MHCQGLIVLVTQTGLVSNLVHCISNAPVWGMFSGDYLPLAPGSVGSSGLFVVSSSFGRHLSSLAFGRPLENSRILQIFGHFGARFGLKFWLRN